MEKRRKFPSKPRNLVARDLLTPKYKMRVVGNKKKDAKNSWKTAEKLAVDL